MKLREIIELISIQEKKISNWSGDEHANLIANEPYSKLQDTRIISKRNLDE